MTASLYAVIAAVADPAGSLDDVIDATDAYLAEARRDAIRRHPSYTGLKLVGGEA